MSTPNTIPVIDLNDYLSDDKNKKQKFVDNVGAALKDVGFFALTNHGLPQDLVSEAYSISEKFFKLDEATKRKYENLEIQGQRGYTSFGREHAKDHDAPDLKEFWHVGQDLSDGHKLADVYPQNIWPKELPSFETTMKDIYQQLERCSLQILEACSLYIGEDKSLFRDMAVDGNTILRLIHYPPIPEDANPASVRAAAHEDINLITLLIDATTSGLEIMDRNGNWLPVVTPRGCIIVDSGDMLQNASNGFYKATTHRVVNPNDSRSRRFSMPFFVHARSEVPLNPIASCVAKTGGEKKYPDITAGEYLHQRLKEIGLS
ncbi:isopenicillin N synthase family dioxygenase [Pseudobacteriovorax antillogorgiicola]|uniref:2-oxoglutarate-dependent ethylene/succinate-forming enzyme n=1 Tax=Pseudobacteriovorax antillogorgiicola TaxID=1513793 RepID=A0A1Y6CR47_9BACT|nr:2-oxoglutarate and iron-dependent oxygenase domain-containing protein [Pseudobacteriovorax antillogorgiicola]TCS41475.1 isopenicillin N synthase-like dioxygenase [Pseudobacteriovorax antillogorgiicola]SMF83599.1 Isopenicillin N synthase [Pseudobacteriovorax antillogorgiicola]